MIFRRCARQLLGEAMATVVIRPARAEGGWALGTHASATPQVACNVDPLLHETTRLPTSVNCRHDEKLTIHGNNEQGPALWGRGAPPMHGGPCIGGPALGDLALGGLALGNEDSRAEITHADASASIIQAAISRRTIRHLLAMGICWHRSTTGKTVLREIWVHAATR